MRFDDFLTELLQREGQTVAAADILGAWTLAEQQSVATALSHAVQQNVPAGQPMNILDWADASNQSRGNKVAKHVIEQIALDPNVAILKRTGAGYPDYWVEIGGAVYALEMKATGKPNPTSTNRTVLLSSTRTLRSALSQRIAQAPIRHVVLQVVYANQAGANPLFVSARIYFLEPHSSVNVRFEASTHQRGLGDVDSAAL